MRLLRLVTAALLVSSAVVFALAEPPSLTRALEAHENGDYEQFYTEMQAAFAESPNDPTVIYNYACANALLGRTDESVQLLGRLADAGVAVDPRFDRDFDPIRGTSAFRAVLKRLLEVPRTEPGKTAGNHAAASPAPNPPKPPPSAAAPAASAPKAAPSATAPAPSPPSPSPTVAPSRPAAAVPVTAAPASETPKVEQTGALAPAVVVQEARPAPRSATSATKVPARPPVPDNPSRREWALPDRDLLPSAVTWEPATRRFFVGSWREHKILAIDRHGTPSEFVGSGKDGLLGPAGLAVDGELRQLWASSAAGPGIAGDVRGSTALLRWDLVSGKFLGRYEPPDTARPHRFGAVTVSSKGNVYVADEAAGTIYELRAGTTELVPLFPSGVFERPAGIAYDERRDRLYVAHSPGLEYVDLAARIHRPVGHDHAEFVDDIGGLVMYGRNLLAIQAPLHRVIAVDLDHRGDRIKGVRVLESDHPLFGQPVMGAVVDDELFYVGNSNLDAIAPDGTLRNPDALPLSVLLRLPLK